MPIEISDVAVVVDREISDCVVQARCVKDCIFGVGGSDEIHTLAFCKARIFVTNVSARKIKELASE